MVARERSLFNIFTLNNWGNDSNALAHMLKRWVVVPSTAWLQ